MTGVTIGNHELTFDGGQEDFGREAVAGQVSKNGGMAETGGNKRAAGINRRLLNY